MTVTTLHSTKRYLDEMVLVRWRLDYDSGKSKMGAWSDPGKHESTLAYAQPRNGLVLAAIEAKGIVSRKTEVICSIAGSDYFKFQWEAVAPIPMKAVSRGSVKVHGRIHGLSLLTTSKKHTVWVNGIVESKDFEGKGYQSWDGR